MVVIAKSGSLWSLCGSDGCRTLTCIIFLPKHISGQFFSGTPSYEFILSSAQAGVQTSVFV